MGVVVMCAMERASGGNAVMEVLGELEWGKD